MMNNHRLRVLLTVPNFDHSGSPYREMIAIAKYLPHDEFDLTVCGLRKRGYEEMKPVLNEMGIHAFVARFRPKGGAGATLRMLWTIEKFWMNMVPFTSSIRWTSPLPLLRR